MTSLAKLLSTPTGETLRRRESVARALFLGTGGTLFALTVVPGIPLLASHGRLDAAAGILSMSLALCSVATKLGRGAPATPLLRRVDHVALLGFTLGMALPALALQLALGGPTAASTLLDGAGLGASLVGLAASALVSSEAGRRVDPPAEAAPTA